MSCDLTLGVTYTPQISNLTLEYLNNSLILVSKILRGRLHRYFLQAVRLTKFYVE